jgi:hypothetical protein
LVDNDGNLGYLIILALTTAKTLQEINSSIIDFIYPSLNFGSDNESRTAGLIVRCRGGGFTSGRHKTKKSKKRRYEMKQSAYFNWRSGVGALFILFVIMPLVAWTDNAAATQGSTAIICPFDSTIPYAVLPLINGEPTSLNVRTGASRNFERLDNYSYNVPYGAVVNIEPQSCWQNGADVFMEWGEYFIALKVGGADVVYPMQFGSVRTNGDNATLRTAPDGTPIAYWASGEQLWFMDFGNGWALVKGVSRQTVGYMSTTLIMAGGIPVPVSSSVNPPASGLLGSNTAEAVHNPLRSDCLIVMVNAANGLVVHQSPWASSEINWEVQKLPDGFFTQICGQPQYDEEGNGFLALGGNLEGQGYIAAYGIDENTGGTVSFVEQTRTSSYNGLAEGCFLYSAPDGADDAGAYAYYVNSNRSDFGQAFYGVIYNAEGQLISIATGAVSFDASCVGQ